MTGVPVLEYKQRKTEGKLHSVSVRVFRRKAVADIIPYYEAFRGIQGDTQRSLGAGGIPQSQRLRGIPPTPRLSGVSPGIPQKWLVMRILFYTMRY